MSRRVVTLVPQKEAEEKNTSKKAVQEKPCDKVAAKKENGNKYFIIFGRFVLYNNMQIPIVEIIVETI